MPLLNINGEYFDPILGMTVPTTSTPGDLYAQDITNDLINNIAPHRHRGPPDGYQLDGDSLNLTLDINFNGTNLDDVRTVRLESLDGPALGPQDLNAVFDVSGDLYFRDGNGNVIRLTKNGQLNVGAFAQTTSFDVKVVTNTNYNILFNDPYTMFQCITSVTTDTITLPIVATVPQGRYYYFIDAGFSAKTNNIIIQVTGGSGNLIQYNGAGSTSYNMVDNGMSALLYGDGSSNWYLIVFDQLTFNNATQSLTLNGANLTVNNATVSLDNTPLDVIGATTLTGNLVQSGTTSSLTNTNLTLEGGTVFFLSNINMVGNAIQGTTNFGAGLTASSGNLNISGAIVNVTSTSGIVSHANQGIVATLANSITSNNFAGITSGVNEGIQLNGGATDTITFAQAHSYSKTYNISVPFTNGATNWQQPNFPYVSGPGSPPAPPPTITVLNRFGVLGLATSVPQLIPIEPPHNGSRLSSVTVWLYVGQTHSSTPANLISLDVLAMSMVNGTASIPACLSSLGGGPQAPNTIDYGNTTTLQSITYTLSANTVNNAGLLYTISLTDENGSNSHSGNVYVAYTLNFTNINNMSFA